MQDKLDHLKRLIELAETGDSEARDEDVLALAKTAHKELSECFDELKSAMTGLLDLTGDEPMDTADSAWAAAIDALKSAGVAIDCGEGTSRKVWTIGGNGQWEMT